MFYHYSSDDCECLDECPAGCENFVDTPATADEVLPCACNNSILTTDTYLF